jgi:hypothetical protein
MVTLIPNVISGMLISNITSKMDMCGDKVKYRRTSISGTKKSTDNLPA